VGRAEEEGEEGTHSRFSSLSMVPRMALIPSVLGARVCACRWATLCIGR
jgi:hypothetical protein